MRAPFVLALPLFLIALPAAAQDTGGMTHHGEAAADSQSVEMMAPPRASSEPRVSPNAAVRQTLGTTDILVQYGRPSVRDRTIWGELVPYGEIWRTGANEATTLTTSAPLLIDGERLSAGSYALFTIPSEDTWTVILNATPAQWGTFNYDASKDALRIEVVPQDAPAQEMLQFRFEEVSETGATLVMHWADLAVPVRIETADG